MRFLWLALLALFACSCATVVRGTSETAKFQSTPSGAAVTAESISEDKQGPYDCVTPCELELKRKRTWKVDFTLEGYKPVSGLLKPQVTGGGLAAGAGNVLIGGLIGVGIDAGTGANLDLRPNPMIAELETVDSPNASRILNAEIVTGVPADAIGDAETTVEEAPEAAAEESGAGEEPAESEAVPEPDSGEAPAPSDDMSDDMEEPAPSSAPVSEQAALENEASDEGAKNVNFDTQPADAPMIEVASPAAAAAGHAADHDNVRLYKPGERAPNDEEADALNSMQLKKALPPAN